MPRPRVNTDELANQLLDEAEAILKENGGKRLIVSDVASRAGMSQSYAYRFFATKADLIRALAQRWFDRVETKSRDAAYSDRHGEKRLEDWVLAILSTKRHAFDEDPQLFLAYLEMAASHMDVVKVHVDRLRSDLRHVVSGLVPDERVEETLALIEDATLLFRTPHNIARYRSQATDERARKVVRFLLQAITD